VTAILKTWPAFMPPKKVLQVFTHDWGNFYFTLGRGRPKQEPKQLWYTHRGRILGYFDVGHIVRNDGSLPKLRSLSDQESEWQIRGDAWVAICAPPFHPLSEYNRIQGRQEKLYHEGFRGWRYFDLEAYRITTGAKVRI
jgi:hypothetical protein